MNIWKRIVKKDLGLCKEGVLANTKEKTENDFKEKKDMKSLDLQIKMVGNQN